MNKHSNPQRPIKNRAWPFKSQDISPLVWWRTLPSHKFRDAETLVLAVSLDRVAVLRPSPQLSAALRGDAAAAIAAALSLLPIEDFTMEVDLVMSMVLRWALNGNAAAALVLESVLGRTNLGHPFANELATSWYAEHTRIASRGLHFSVDEAALLEAVEGHYAAIEQWEPA